MNSIENYLNDYEPPSPRVIKVDATYSFLVCGCWGTYCLDGYIKTDEVTETCAISTTYELYGEESVANGIKELCLADPSISSIILTGDNIYANPLKRNRAIHDYQVSNTLAKYCGMTKQEKLDISYDIEEQLGTGFGQCFGEVDKDFFVLVGNHDVKRDSCIDFFTQLQYGENNPKWHFGLYYNMVIQSSDGAPLLNIMCIDTNVYSEGKICGKSGESIIAYKEKQAVWLRDTTAAVDAKYNIVIGHVPAVANGHKFKTQVVITSELKALLTEVNPQLYICSDEHNQQFLYEDSSNTGFAVLGSGGTILDENVFLNGLGEIGPDKSTATLSDIGVKTYYALPRHGFARVDVEDNGIILSFYAVESARQVGDKAPLLMQKYSMKYGEMKRIK